MHMALRFRATALGLSLLPAFVVACGEDPVDANNNFTSNGDDMGTAGTDDEVGTEDASSDGTDASTDDDASSSTADDDDPSDSSEDDPSDTSDGPTSDTDVPGECETPPELVGTSCGENTGIKGPVAKGESITDLPVGGIMGLDNGLGNGEEDWYQIEFPVALAAPRPTAGTPTISFAVNEGDDFRFEIYRDCGAEAYGQGLASEFGSNAPPLTEWSFNDIDPGMFEQLQYMELVPWPSTVWVRVFRFQNDGECTNYQLVVTRP
jgi:hypothetical protein